MQLTTLNQGESDKKKGKRNKLFNFKNIHYAFQSIYFVKT